LPGDVDRSRHREDDVNLAIDQLGGQIRKKLAIPGRGSVFDDDILADDIAKITETVEERLAFSGGRISQGRQD